MKNLIALIALAGLLAGCGYSMDEIVVVGTVTYQEAPVASGQVSLAAGTVAGTAADIEFGNYRVRAEFERPSCALAVISVIAFDESGAVIGEGERNLGSCGTHVLNFAF